MLRHIICGSIAMYIGSFVESFFLWMVIAFIIYFGLQIVFELILNRGKAREE